MPKVILLCGMIASGKTTYANKLRKQTNAIILSCDDLILTIFDTCLGANHDKTEERINDYFCRLAINIVESGVDAVLDMGYWSELVREKTLSFFKQNNVLCELHYVKIPEAIRTQRLKERNEKLSNSPKREYIIDENLKIILDKKFEEPTIFDVLIKE